MKTMIIISLIVSILTLVGVTAFFLLWLKAEMELSKSNKSKFFIKKNKGDK